MNLENIDLLIGGAGPVGCVVAERAASQLGWRCLVVERRGHIGGNCYDYLDESGLLVHKYGSHYFRTNELEVVKYLSNFTAWIPGDYIVKSSVKGELFPFPVSLDTLRKFFNQPGLTPEAAEKLLEEKREKIDNPQNLEEYILANTGRELYEAFYKGYAEKQWGVHPKELSQDVLTDIHPQLIKINNQGAYTFNIMPADGYSRMFERMLANSLITVELNADYREIKNLVSPKATVYTGPIDEYFNNMHGGLPWRSLDFKTEVFDEEFRQPCVQINFPNEFEYIRAVEAKHVTRQKHPQTTVLYEIPRSYGEPFYPFPTAEGKELYEQYRVLAQHEAFINNVYFAGRLAEYTYINTDEAITRGLEVFDKIKNSHG